MKDHPNSLIHVVAQRTKTVCHLTTVHPRWDTRVFHKECKGLASLGYRVELIVNDGRGREEFGNLVVSDLNMNGNRLARLFLAMPMAFVAALRTKAQIYHFHDPELLGVGAALALLGKKVIYDVHEDVPRQILYKTWIRPAFRKVLSRACELTESGVSRLIAACVCVTPHIADRFRGYGANVALVRNFPIVNVESADPKPKGDDGHFLMCYAGSLTVARGVREMIALAEKAQTKLVLIGPCHEKSLLPMLDGPGASPWIEYLGVLGKPQLEEQYRRCDLGLAILHPTATYVDSLPVKVFEYMMFGMPVLCSNFDLWREIVEANQAGYCLDPADIEGLAKAVSRLKNNPDLARSMAANGKKAVLEKYSWEIELATLVNLYESIPPQDDRQNAKEPVTKNMS